MVFADLGSKYERSGMLILEMSVEMLQIGDFEMLFGDVVRTVDGDRIVFTIRRCI